MTATEAPRLLTAGDIARLLGCSVRQVQRLAKDGKMPRGHKLVGLRRWKLDEIAAWLAGGLQPVNTPATN